MYTPKDRMTEYQKMRMEQRMRKLLPLLAIAWVITTIVLSGSSDYLSGIR